MPLSLKQRDRLAAILAAMRQKHATNNQEITPFLVISHVVVAVAPAAPVAVCGV